MNARRPYLLMSRIGAQSVHASWLDSALDRKFDVFLSAYDRDVPPAGTDDVLFEYRPGPKVAGYGAMLHDHAERIARYDYVAIFDDDLTIDTEAIERLFAICAQHRFKIAQPALSHDSHFTYAALLRHPGFTARHMTYVEMMCPVFRKDALQAARPLFAEGFESGIDLVWCNLLAEAQTDFAVIDAVTVRHGREVGTLKARNGFGASRSYEDDIHAILARFGLPWISCVPYSAIDLRGRPVRGRWRHWLAIPALIAAVIRCRGWRLRARSVAVYARHLMIRRARNFPVRLQERKT